MRIAFVVTSMERAGAQGMLLKLLPGLSSYGFSPIVISLSSPGPLSQEFADLGLPIHHLNVAPGRVSTSALRQLIRIFKSARPELVQGWMYHGNLAAQLAAWFVPKRPPVAWGIRGTHTHLSNEKLLTALTIWSGAKLSRYSAAVIYNSRVGALEHWRKLRYHREREVVIPNGFDVTAFKPQLDGRARLRDELGVPRDTVLVGLVARFHPVKDHATFIEAIAHTRAKRANVHGVLVGEGAENKNPHLQKLLARTNMTGFVHCLGERGDVPLLTAGFDIACNSSVSEGFPNAIGEAMACGVPCVVTDVGDSGWIVGKAGRVVPASDPKSFAAALDDLLSLKPLERIEVGERARQRIVDDFSLVAVVKRYAELYEMLLRRSR